MHRQSCKYYHFPGRTFVLFSCYILSSHHFVSKFNRSGRGERTIQKRSGVLPGLITMKNKWCKWTPWWSCVTGAIKAMDAQYIFKIDSCYCGHFFLPYFSFSSNGVLDSVPILFDCWWESLSCFRKYRDYVKRRWQTACWSASERCTEYYSNDIKWFDKGFTDRFELNIFCVVISIVLGINLYVIIS